MTPELIVVWDGVKERNGEAPGLASPLIGSAARLCMAYGADTFGRKPKAKRTAGTCERCGYIFDPVARERLCITCFTATNRPSWT